MLEFELQIACCSQFNSVRLIWMFWQKTIFILRLNRYIIRRLKLFTSQMSLIVICYECNGSTSFYQRHLQFLFTEISKSTVITDPIFMWHFFKEREAPYDLKKDAVLYPFH